MNLCGSWYIIQYVMSNECNLIFENLFVEQHFLLVDFHVGFNCHIQIIL